MKRESQEKVVGWSFHTQQKIMSKHFLSRADFFKVKQKETTRPNKKDDDSPNSDRRPSRARGCRFDDGDVEIKEGVEY